MVIPLSKEIRKPLLCSPSQCEKLNAININQENVVQVHPLVRKQQEIKKTSETNDPPRQKKRKLFTNTEFDNLPLVDD